MAATETPAQYRARLQAARAAATDMTLDQAHATLAALRHTSRATRTSAKHTEFLAANMVIRGEV